MAMLWVVNGQHQCWRLSRFLPSFRQIFGEVSSLSTSTGQLKKPPAASQLPEPVHFIVDYLVSSCGLSRAEALKASKRLTHLKSSEKPDAVLCLLKQIGLGDAEITRAVRGCPSILVADPKKTLEPKIRALQQVGFSELDLARLISRNPKLLRVRDVIAKVDFWRKLLGSDDKLLRVAKNAYILGANVDDKIGPNIAFLRSLGVSDIDIARFIPRSPLLAARSVDKNMSLVEQVKRYGILPGSGRFMEALSTVCNVNQTGLEARSKILRNLGWSSDELLHAFQKFPVVLRLSEKKITKAMNFLVKEAGYKPSYVARRPVLLGYSVDRRLIPRYKVLQFLKKKRLPGGNVDLLSVIALPDQKFLERFIVPFGKRFPELLRSFPVVNAE